MSPQTPPVSAAVAPGASDERDAPALPLWTTLAVLGSAAGGAVLAAGVLPYLFPALAASILGPDAKAYWYVSRSSAFVAFALL
ncbi:MAG TPA: hypothetical protein VFX49_15755, partial [Chloroflexota bacterium]|nr:hypothetical protein [Chloroflexota bacterium]